MLVGVLAQVAQAQAAACVAVPGAPRLDHVVVVVRNLDSAAARFRPLGFRFKLGRLHPDSLVLVRALAGSEPRVLGVEIRHAPGLTTPRHAPLEPLPGFWLLLR